MNETPSAKDYEDMVSLCLEGRPGKATSILKRSCPSWPERRRFKFISTLTDEVWEPAAETDRAQRAKYVYQNLTLKNIVLFIKKNEDMEPSELLKDVRYYIVRRYNNETK